MEYRIRRARQAPALDAAWDAPGWAHAEVAVLGSARPESSDHRPRTEVKVLYDSAGLYAIFRVQDRYVRSVNTEYNSSVCQDSCVELFVKPRTDKGYFNFETNCGGAILCSYIEDATRIPGGFKRFTRLSAAALDQVRIHSSLPKTVEPEVTTPTTWTNALFIPLKVLAQYLGPLPEPKGEVWSGNFYKCGDKTSHPHWLSWAPVAELNFHRPQDFQALRFEA